MSLAETLTWPFFEEHHRRFANELARWADATLPSLPRDDVDEACRARVAALGEAGFLKACLPVEYGGLHPKLDVRTLCIARETLAFRDGLADFALAMQGLGTGSISLYGSPELKARYLPSVGDGKTIAAFALSEPEGGSDVVAMATLDIFRATVGAAALGFARRALHESVEHAATRNLFGAPLGELQMTQAAIADSATEVDAAALLVYRAAWTKDKGATRVTREAAMAKMFATEAAQRVIDRAVQLHGGRGVTKGEKVEELYREIRALRIYEGATEVQRSEEHTLNSSHLVISYAVFCLKKKKR